MQKKFLCMLLLLLPLSLYAALIAAKSSDGRNDTGIYPLIVVCTGVLAVVWTVFIALQRGSAGCLLKVSLFNKILILPIYIIAAFVVCRMFSPDCVQNIPVNLPVLCWLLVFISFCPTLSMILAALKTFRGGQISKAECIIACAVSFICVADVICAAVMLARMSDACQISQTRTN